MNNELTKKFYKIKDVADLLGVPQSTLRFWESEFSEISPNRSRHNQRQYSPADVETLRIIHFLVKVKGMKIDSARLELSRNKKNISKRLEIIDKLKGVRDEIEGLLKNPEKRSINLG